MHTKREVDGGERRHLVDGQGGSGLVWAWGWIQDDVGPAHRSGLALG